MPDIIEISCPECQRRIKAPASGIGKKIRCKGCQNLFLVEDPAKKKVAPKRKPRGKPAAPRGQKPGKPGHGFDDDEEDSNPYDITELNEAPRCPGCANELEYEEQVICLHCGYNLQTRTRLEKRSVAEKTGGDKFLWLLPGILCVLAILLMIGYCFFHHFAMPGMVDKSFGALLKEASKRGIGRVQFFQLGEDDEFKVEHKWFWYFWHPGVELWIWVLAIWGSWKAGRFAFKRLYLNPEPPDIVVEKTSRDEED